MQRLRNHWRDLGRMYGCARLRGSRSLAALLFLSTLSCFLSTLSCDRLQSDSQEGSVDNEQGESGELPLAPILSPPAAVRPKGHQDGQGESGSAPMEALNSRSKKGAKLSALRLATWNMQWLGAQVGQGTVPRRGSDYAKLGEYAEKMKADVIAVQEVDGEQALKRVFPEDKYRFFVVGQSNQQRTAFVVRREIEVKRHPDLVKINVGGLRAGVDIELQAGNGPLRVLALHLKSGCFQGPLDRSSACRKLAQQVPHLEDWIDQRQSEGVSFAVLGDFNRRFFADAHEAIWDDLDDGEPKGLQLWSPTEGERSTCKGGRYPDFIDHLIVSSSLRPHVKRSGFHQWTYAKSDRRYTLSDHCPLSLDLAW